MPHSIANYVEFFTSSRSVNIKVDVPRVMTISDTVMYNILVMVDGVTPRSSNCSITQSIWCDVYGLNGMFYPCMKSIRVG